MGYNNNNSSSSENTNFGQEEEVLEAKKCGFCSRTTGLTRETEIFYNAGRNRRIANLCYDIVRYNEALPVSDSCSNKYYSDLGFNLIVVGWYEDAYATVLSMFISSPLVILSSSGNGDMTIAKKIISTNTNTTIVSDLPFDTAIQMAYNLDQVTRRYLDAVDRDKVPDVLDVERNPRIFPLRWQLCQDSRVIKVQDEPLTFKWNRSAASSSSW